MDINKVRWVEQGGSIYAEPEQIIKGDFNDIKMHPAVAFNVGRETARKLVELHNASLGDA